MKVKQIVGEHKKGVRAVKYNSKPQPHIEPPKPRNFVAKNQQTSGAGVHKDEKKASQAVRGQKHKGQMDMAEDNAGISKDKETKFHAKLDKLVHGTFGKRDDEVGEVFDNDKETGTTHKGGIVTKTKHGIKHTKTDYDDGNPSIGQRKEPNSRWKHSSILDKDDDVDEGRRQYLSYHDELRSRERDEQDHMDRERRDFKHQELQHELGHERNNIQVTINGRPWKVFAGKGNADSFEERQHLRKMQQWAERKSETTGKKWSVHLTGADPSVEEGEGKVTAVDPTKGVEITNPETGVKTTLPPKMSSALAPDAQNPNRYTLNPQAASAGSSDKETATGPKVGSQVAIPDQATEEDMLSPTPADSTSPIHGGTVDCDEPGDRDHDQMIHLLKKLAGMREMDNGPVSVQVGSKGDMLGIMKRLGGR